LEQAGALALAGATRRNVESAPGAILVGHSLGCLLIADLAWRRPDLRIG
jgi:predicted alpha/beta hydrolase family esterase